MSTTWGLYAMTKAPEIQMKLLEKLFSDDMASAPIVPLAVQADLRFQAPGASIEMDGGT